MKEEHLSVIRSMVHSPIKNYVIPGLTSYLIGQPGADGTVRVFHNERDHQENITPHSHRFDFTCIVLRGSVTNRIWERVDPCPGNGDFYMVSEINYCGDVGRYEKSSLDVSNWNYYDLTYNEGDSYSMTHDQVHSIKFSRGAIVLFLEGPTVTNKSIVIEPFVDGQHIETMAVQKWMFKK